MWNYVLKNLILFDRFVDEKLFLWDISDLNVLSVDKFHD